MTHEAESVKVSVHSKLALMCLGPLVICNTPQFEMRFLIACFSVGLIDTRRLSAH